jgi:iron complex transport system substrate-binding protein
MFRSLLIVTLVFALLTACAPAAAPAVETAAEPVSAPAEASAPVAESESQVEPAPQVFVPEKNLTEGCIPEGQFDASVDYFPEKVTLEYTENFSVEYFNHYKLVTVETPWPGATESMQYVLVQCGTPAPEGFVEEQIIPVPVASIVTMSTSYLPFLDSLGLLDRLVGLDDATYVYNPTVLQMAEEGKLAMLGYGSGVNVEQALDLSPDLIMTYGSGFPDYDAHPVLIQSGLKVAINAEWMDTSPLGRAEWGKFMAVFFNKEADSQVVFAETAQKYNDLKTLAAGAEAKPSVFSGTPWQGVWSMPGGNSFAAAFFRDAGAEYLWADDTSAGSLALDFEAVYERAQDADLWLNVGFVFTLDDLQAADARYADFAAFKNDAVWNNDARMSASGGTDFYESAVARPDVVLADLVKIFHPDLLPDHELVYYRPVK